MKTIHNMIQLYNYQLYQLSGTAVLDFLQGQVCSDVKLLEEGGSQLTGICNAKGRLVASPYLLLKNGEYYLALEKDMVEILFKYWKPYLMISRVTAKLCEHFNAYGCLDEPELGTHNFKITYAGETQAKIIFTKEPLANTTTELEWFANIVQSGVVIIQPETSKLFMPITLAYEKFDALSFNKGCYVGQEILARVHFKGSVKQQIVKIAFSEKQTIEANQNIMNMGNKIAGYIVISPKDKNPVTTTLAVIKKSCIADGLSLENGARCRIL